MIGTYAELMARISAQEPHRHACEVRWLASFDTDAKRAVYLSRVWDQRGEAAAKKLRSDVWAYMRAAEKPVEPLQESLL